MGELGQGAATMTDFEDLDDVPPLPKRKRVPAVWLWLFVVSCFVALAAVLYFQYDVWVHPIHEPTALDLAEQELNARLGMPVEILSSETIHGAKGQPLLRVIYRQQKAGGGWLPGDRVYYIEDRKILWSQDFRFWKWEVE
jgi:hypothetical protein